MFRTSRFRLRLLACSLLAGFCAQASAAPYQMEKLDRGVVAVRTGSGVYVGWRLLGLDPSNIGFNVYRGSTKVNAAVITTSTNLLDSGANLGGANTYTVRPVINGVEQAATDAGFTLPANAATQQYLRLALQNPGSGYSPGDCSVGDVDGDGQYEIFLKWDPSNQRDNSQTGVTSVVYIDCYRLNGTRLWRVNLGRNIRAGAHYTQFQVADYDGDGRAEMVVKTGDGSISGTGQVIGNGSANHVNSGGHILTGPEFLTAFNGLTGAVISTVPYQPVRGSVSDYGDGNGNRSERYLAGTAWLDGQRPSVIMGRGYYARTKVAAWDLRNGALTLRWAFDSAVGGNSAYGGRGTHWLSIADVDNNGSGHEIIYGGMTLNPNGTGRYTTTFYAHGDALHVGDFISNRAGQEIWQIHESGNIAATLRDGITGAIIFSKANTTGGEGPARGVGDDISASNPGAEFWASGVAFSSASGASIGRTPGSQNFLAYWDNDFTRELLDGNHVDKYGTGGDTRLFTATGASAINGSKSTPNLSADILGDWREEIILTEGASAIRIYTTTNVTNNRIHTLMHDPQYRAQVAAQNSAYNQPPHLSFLPSVSIPSTPRSDITYGADTPTQPVAPTITDQPTATTVSVGNSASFSVTATGTTPLSYQWRKDGTAISGATSASFTISSAQVADAGTYSVVVTNVAGTVISTGALLTVTSSNNIPATGISVSPTTASVAVGATTTLTATIAPANATNKTVTWSSSAPTIATVSASGIVTGVAAGSATITARAQDGGFTATSAITVTGGGGTTPCSNPVTRTTPFVQNGAGEFCFVTSSNIAYINSWNMELVEINGVVITNVWSNTLPARINGNYYIRCIGNFPWSHVEVN